MSSTRDTSLRVKSKHAQAGDLACVLGELDARAVVDDAERNDDGKRDIDRDHVVDVLLDGRAKAADGALLETD